MKGDFSRDTFDRDHPRSGVRLQQGRVLVDADWNEQVDVQDDLRETALRDVIGLSGVPEDDLHAFEVTVAGPGLVVEGGRIWVDGVLCRGGRTTIDDTLLDPLRKSGLPALVYLEVWQRHLTAIEEPPIREVALGGPDTATRTRTVCRIGVEELAAGALCRTVPAGWRPKGETTGSLAARATPPATSDDPCVVPSQAGYTGLENLLYRVEIHAGGETGSGDPTFKWSRDNGSVLTELEEINGQVLTVQSLGRDKARGFFDAEWVEISWDELDLQGLPGLLVEIEKVEPGADGRGHLTAVAGTPLPTLAGKGHPKVRRWDSGPIPITPGTWQALGEHHVEVLLAAGVYRACDYWMIPARAFVGELLGSIEWPQSGGSPASVAPHGVERHVCKLAVVRWQGSLAGGAFDVEDCRPLFPPLTRLLRFLAVGGQGQTGVGGELLACPLRVAVVNALRPVEGARVRFDTRGNGTVIASDLGGTIVDAVALETLTGPDGIASCQWRLPPPGKSGDCIDVKAELVEVGGRHIATAPYFFGATLVEPQPRTVRVLEVALRGGKQPLPNDSEVNLFSLEEGISIVCDDVIEGCFFGSDRTNSGVRPRVEVTVFYPLEWLTDLGANVGRVPVRLLANVSGQETRIVWEPGRDVLSWLGRILKRAEGTPLLAELRAHGNFLWAQRPGEAPEDPRRHLDGELFGRPVSTQIALELPSGDGRQGGDLFMWFWIVGEPFRIELRPGLLSLSGRVLTFDESPLLGATITVKQSKAQKITTDSLGRFQLSKLEAGEATVTADVAGFGSVTRTTTIPSSLVVKPSDRLPIRGTSTDGAPTPAKPKAKSRRKPKK